MLSDMVFVWFPRRKRERNRRDTGEMGRSRREGLQEERSAEALTLKFWLELLGWFYWWWDRKLGWCGVEGLVMGLEAQDMLRDWGWGLRWMLSMWAGVMFRGFGGNGCCSYGVMMLLRLVAKFEIW